MTQNFSFEFESRRCFFDGRLYYVEKGGPSANCPYCPYCAHRNADKRNDELASARAQQERLGHVIAGLRGALKRARAK